MDKSNFYFAIPKLALIRLNVLLHVSPGLITTIPDGRRMLGGRGGGGGERKQEEGFPDLLIL